MIQDLINKLKHLPDDRIGDGIYSAFEWSENRLMRMYIGSKINGPMLQFDAPRNFEEDTNISVRGIEVEIPGVNKHYNGYDHVDFKNGAWTNCYSRGNFGRKYAYGGNWSGHTKNLHPRLKMSPIKDVKTELLAIEGEETIVLPEGIKGNVSMTEIDCSGSWVIFYTTAKIALANRLTKVEIPFSALPDITKNHLLKNETQEVIECLNDVIEAYNL